MEAGSDEHAELASAALADLTAARRRRRLTGLDWFDALYSVYLTAIVIVIATAVVSAFLPEGQVAASTADRVADDGPALLGLVLSLLLAIGVRSGGRGGPLALEAANVQHVLLAPVDRTEALRGPALHQLRFAAFVGAGVGATAGLSAAGRLPGAAVAYVVAGAATGALVTLLAMGLALVVSGRRWGMWVADGIAAVLLGLAAVDLTQGTRLAPGTWLASLALAPLEASPVPIALGVLVALGVPVVGVLGVGDASLEASMRRADLVGQLRFAVTLQDLRTVILLRRQLAQERPRSRPWVRLRVRDRARAPVLRRGVRSLLRFPAVRLVRMGALGVIAGLALRGMWNGTTPLLLVGALALFVAALDAIEPMSEEADRPDAWASHPLPDGILLLRHLVAPGMAMLVVGLVAVAAAGAAGPSRMAFELGLAALPVAVVAAVAGAAASVVSGGASSSLAVAMPEAAGTSLIFRVAWPPGLVALALAPLLAARSADAPVTPLTALLNVEALVAMVVAVVLLWLSTRKAPRR